MDLAKGTSVVASAALRQQILTELIRERRSIFADSYIDKEIPRHIIEEVLINATWAPNHKMTQPWRFIVLRGLQKQKFGQYMADYYRELLPDRYEQLLHYPDPAGCMVVIIMKRSQKVALPDWEELAAVSCAVQNMALTCTAFEIGSYWDTCMPCIQYAEQLGLDASERCLGFFYMGYYDTVAYESNKRRTSIDQKVTWLDH
jgi:nitroreductase